MENETHFNSSENQQMPNNNMPLAIVGTVLGCCSTFGIGFIIGIVAIYLSTQVKAKFNAGDSETAEKYSKYVKYAAFAAIGLTIVNLIYVGSQWSEVYPQFMEQYEKAMEAQGQ